MTHYLYVSRDHDGNFDHDGKIEQIVGSERIGSGAGFGTRDMDFEITKAPTMDELQALKMRIQTECGINVDVIYEEWGDDNRDEDEFYQDEPLVVLEA